MIHTTAPPGATAATAPGGRMVAMQSDPPRRLAAILFDMDGTLVDSEKVWDVALHELAERNGGRLSDGARAAMVGTDMTKTMAILQADIGRSDLDEAENVRWLHDRTGELFAEGLVWKPGARDLLVAVEKAGIPAALVTATPRRLVETALDTIGRDFFATVVTGDDIVNSKPHPEPYRNAAALLGADPRDTVAIEDSPTGLSSARAAGCTVLAIPSEVELTDIAGVTLRESLVGVDVDYLESLLPSAR